MGKADTVTKDFMRNNEVFADAFNFLIYGGEPVVDPKSLKELDTTEIALPFLENKKGHLVGEAVQKYRDVLKTAAIKQDQMVSYILFGIENQTDIHYAMPVRNMIYDALQYGKQISDIAAKKRKRNEEFSSKSEYLSGFTKTDRIRPVITLVIHFGADKWDAPLSLREMMDIQNEQLLKYVQDYKIFLIDPASLNEGDLKKFSTSLGDVLGYIKYSLDKNELNKFVNRDPNRCISADAARVIRDVTNTPIKIAKGMEVVNMCQAIKDMISESEEKSREEGRRDEVFSCVKDKIYTEEIGAKRLGLTLTKFKNNYEKWLAEQKF